MFLQRGKQAEDRGKRPPRFPRLGNRIQSGGVPPCERPAPWKQPKAVAAPPLGGGLRGPPRRSTWQEGLMGEVVLEANSKHGALGNFLEKSSQGTLMGQPGQGPPHWLDRSRVSWGLLRVPLSLPAYPKWAFLGLLGAQYLLWVVASIRPHRVPSILRVSLQILPWKALVIAGCFLRAPGLCSELGAELGPSNLRSHPQTGQDPRSMESRLPSGSARALGVLWLDTLSSLWLTHPSAAWFLHRQR